MTSLQSAKRRGASWETAVADYLARHVDDHVERRHLSGAQDRGDIAGLRIAGHRLVVECKATTAMDVAGHLREAATEASNDAALCGIVVQKRRGIGMDSDDSMGQQLVMLTLSDFARLLNVSNRAADHPAPPPVPSAAPFIDAETRAAIDRLAAAFGSHPTDPWVQQNTGPAWGPTNEEGKDNE